IIHLTNTRLCSAIYHRRQRQWRIIGWTIGKRVENRWVGARMDRSHGALAHHFETLPQQREANTLGMWLFLATEVLFFGGLFTVYFVYRTAFSATFAEASQHLDPIRGIINTVVLLT